VNIHELPESCARHDAGSDPVNQVIYLRADERVPFGAFASVMDAVKQAGITNISIVTQPLETKSWRGGILGMRLVECVGRTRQLTRLTRVGLSERHMNSLLAWRRATGAGTGAGADDGSGGGIAFAARRAGSVPVDIRPTCPASFITTTGATRGAAEQFR
jgi:hypothetical protein